jgi:hypothetical protein
MMVTPARVMTPMNESSDIQSVFLFFASQSHHNSWRIDGEFMADSWRMGLQKLITGLDMRNG